MLPAWSCAAEPLTDRIAVGPGTSAAAVQAFVRAFARRSGAGVRDEWCLAIAASEAATNIEKFAGCGSIAVRLLAAPRAIEIVAEDEGPGFADLAFALRDGVSEGVDLTAAEPQPGRRGLGTGLGAIRRVMDRLEILTRPEGGTRLVARRVLRG